MNEWWESLTNIQHFFYYIAVPSTLVLVIQFVLSIIGLGNDSDFDSDMDTDVDVDFDTDVDMDTDFDMDADMDMDISDVDADVDFDEVDVSEIAGADLQLVSFRTIIAFLTIFSWVGIVLSGRDIDLWIIIIISSLAGFVAMVVIAYIFFLTSKLQSSGNINYRNAIGQTAEVYIPIPANGKQKGKVTLVIQDRLVEANAITYMNKKFETGELVKIIDVVGLSTLVVEKLN